jgi:putative ABC transport system permease protein
VKTRNRMLMRDLWHLRGQVIAAALVVMCGVASFVAMRCTYDSLRLAQADYYREYRFADVFSQLKRAPESLAARIADIPGVSAVRTRVVVGVTLDVPGLAEPASGRLVSVPERRAPMLNDLYIERGRYIEPGRSDEAIASKAFADANGLSLGDTLGAVINGRWKRLTIVGIGLSPEYIYEVGAGTIFPDNRRFGVLWMGEPALAAAWNMEGAFNDVSLSLSAGALEAEVIDRLDRLLAAYGGLGAHGREEQVSHRFISDEIAQNRVTSTWVPAIFLGVAAFLLHIVLSRLVTLQRTEIGLLKAFGYGNRTVGLHYLRLAAITVLSGVAAGSAAGLWLGDGLTALYQDYYRFPELVLVVTPGVVLTGIGISLLAATVGALSAVRHAVSLPPAVAMRPEPPPGFHAGALERSGLAQLLPASGRMIARSIARRRWKSLMTVLAIACAGGILVVGGYFLDAVNHLMRVQFEVIQRDDVMIVFTEPASAGVRHEVALLPGVLRAEPFRAVPARLRFGHREKRIDITGLEPRAELRRLIGSDERPVALPPDGLLLSAKLAELLGALQHLHFDLVAGLVDELVGLGAYMDAQALNRMMREGGSISGAWLSVDPRAADALYAALKRLPAVAGVAFRDAMLSSFREIMDRSLVTTTLINIAFASIIAFGVVYNGARIALSERGNELASLRVLGFTRREVSVLLLGEQGLLTLAAIPLGFAFGVAICWLLSASLDTEFYRIPLVFSTRTFGLALTAVLAAAAISGVLVARRINRLDLVAVLKTRE